MPYRPKDIYRGRRKFRVPLSILLFTLTFLLVGGIGMFFFLQQYMVYDADGATLQLPFGGGADQAPEEALEGVPTPKPTFEPVEVQVVWENPDFEDVDMGSWDTLKPVRGLFISQSTLQSLESLSSATAAVQGGGYNAAVLEVKGRNGQLVWPSAAETALAYHTDGTMDLTGTIEQLHKSGLTVAAQLSCFADSLLLQHNWSFALRYTDGSVCQNEDGSYWLDPYNQTVRTYLTDLALELADMGFDEIILADLYHPLSEDGFIYTETPVTGTDPVVAVCQMGRRIVEALEDTEADTVVSVRINPDSLRNGQGSLTGQDIPIFWRMFARLYCATYPELLASDKEMATETMNGGDADARFVPVIGIVPEQGSKSYVIG